MDLKKLSLLVGSTLTVMSGATIAPSLPQIEQTFAGAENVALLTRLVLTIPALFIALGAPLVGALTDKLGRLPILFTSLFLYGLAGTAGLYTETLFQLLFSRALLGVSVAGIMTSITTLIGDYYEGEERNQTMGLQAAFMALGGFVFLTVGGMLADISWRWPFAVYAFVLFVIPASYSALREPVNTTATPKGELQKKSMPIVEKWLVGLTFFVALLFMIIFYMIPVQLPFYLKQIGVESSTQAGVAIAALTLSGGITSLFYRKIKQLLTFNAIYTFLFLLSAIGYMLLSYAETYTLVLFAQVIGGIGFGLFMPNANTCLLNMAPLHLRGRIVSGMTAAVFLGQFLSPVAVSPLLAYTGLALSYRIAGFVLLSLTSIYFFGVLRHKAASA